MRNLISKSSRPFFGATLTALLATSAFTVSVPMAQADAPTADVSKADEPAVGAKITVPRLFKGISNGFVHVKPNSPEARMYFASQVPSQNVTANGFCPGTVCLQTKTCYTSKGALGAGCKTR
jgi:hypothetical protein